MTGAHEQQVRQQFGAAAAAYVTSAGHAGGDDLQRLVSWGRSRPPGRVLDVATGGGHTALAFAEFSTRVVAFDVTEPMLVAARRFLDGRGVGNVAFTAGTVEALPFRDEAFPLVTCRIAAHHFASVAAAVREIARVLTPGGSLLVQDILGHDDPELAAFVTEIERRRDPSHVRAYREREWKAMLKGAGLTVMDQAVIRKSRRWDDWTSRMRMTPEARRALDAFVHAAPAAHRSAFEFTLTASGVESFADRLILLRADKD